MPPLPVVILLSLSLASTLLAAETPRMIPAAEAPRMIDVPMHSIDDQGQPTVKSFAVPLRLTGCDGVFDVVSLETSLELDKKMEGRMLLLYLHVDATLKKLAAGPVAPPQLIVENDGKKVTVPFATIIAAQNYEEAGAILHERLTSPELTLSAGWKSVELRCSSASPWRAPVIPPEVTYVRKPDAEVAAAVAKVRAAIASPSGFGTPSLYDEMVIIGPDLYKQLQNEPELATFQSPKIVTIDPNTKVSRSMLRAKGPEELALFHKVLTRYLGATTPRRLRPATSAELSAHWVNIGWDIDEPLLILDTGAHRLVLDVSGGGVGMVDEVP
jgi:hypothetical protein